MRSLTLFTLVSIGCLAGCHEKPHSYYATAASAVKDGAIERGWLPDVFVSDVSEIHESHDLDSNRGKADFSYAPGLILRLNRQCTSTPRTDGQPMYRCGEFDIWLDPAQQRGHLSH